MLSNGLSNPSTISLILDSYAAMQNIFVEKPYKFVPAMKARWPCWLYARLGLHRLSLQRREGVTAIECRNVDRIKESVKAGHGVLITPNHPRTADPGVMAQVAYESGHPFFTMASWHIFNQGWLVRNVIRMMGGFSVNREGMDRQAIDYAINVLRSAKRPLLIFPEGTTSRTNDQLMALMEGPSFIARAAAKRREKEDGGKVVVHPVAIRYTFGGDLEKVADEVLIDLEKKLTWSPKTGQPLVERLVRVGDALLKIKELEYGCPVSADATLRQRQSNMVNHLLYPLEQEWLGSAQGGGIQIRIKNLRVKIFPEMIHDELEPDERKRRWEHLQRTYLAQQIDCYPEKYVTRAPTPDRVLETLEKFEEDFVGKCRIHGDLKAVVDVGEAITVSSKRDKQAVSDPLMTEIRTSIESMLANTHQKSARFVEAPSDKANTQ